MYFRRNLFTFNCVYVTSRIMMKELALQIVNAVKNGILRVPFNGANG
jgi:hypothetical protein